MASASSEPIGLSSIARGAAAGLRGVVQLGLVFGNRALFGSLDSGAFVTAGGLCRSLSVGGGLVGLPHGGLGLVLNTLCRSLFALFCGGPGVRGPPVLGLARLPDIHDRVVANGLKVGVGVLDLFGAHGVELRRPGERLAAFAERGATLFELGVSQHATDLGIERPQRVLVEQPRRGFGIQSRRHVSVDELQWEPGNAVLQSQYSRWDFGDSHVVPPVSGRSGAFWIFGHGLGLSP